ncbi:ejaculatory bulb-specific protein 3-like [Schistocerca cancellata]|uniref:ejaculatory bulb-specific protein 3-like n=1 Tax=Schistocerca cancellata TaxID=274614 RepID=UPI0021179065|nr:ejaculatory bulb-specific protein 3-like [Schistocerca cancellata]
MRYEIAYEKIKDEKDQEPYSRKYDKVNLDEVLASERLLNSYSQCPMSDTEESCTADAKYLKAAIPGALCNGCSRCRQRQRQDAEKVIKFLMKNKPDLWNQLEAKYNPKGVYRIKYEKEYQRLKEEQGASEGITSA